MCLKLIFKAINFILCYYFNNLFLASKYIYYLAIFVKNSQFSDKVKWMV